MSTQAARGSGTGRSTGRPAVDPQQLAEELVQDGRHLAALLALWAVNPNVEARAKVDPAP
jgi:hypothetical protein